LFYRSVISFSCIQHDKSFGKSRCTVGYNTNQTCCGQPAFNAGFWGEAKEVCIKFINDFSDQDYIVAPSASCVGFVRNYYGKLFENSSLYNDVKRLGERLFEFSEFLVKVLQVEDLGASLYGQSNIS
jgi:L-lactate dehydrogenase complex protein LldE